LPHLKACPRLGLAAPGKAKRWKSAFSTVRESSGFLLQKGKKIPPASPDCAAGQAGKFLRRGFAPLKESGAGQY